MRRALALALLACLGTAAPAAADGLRITPAKTGAFPQRSYLLTLPSKAPVRADQVSVTENGAPVSGLTVTSASAIGQHHFGTVLLIQTSTSMRGAAINTALAAARSFVAKRSSEQPLGIIEFDSAAHVALPLGTDQAAIERTLASPPHLASGMHIYNAVATGLQMLAQANVTAGSVIVLSDGALTGRLSEKASEQRKAHVISAAHAQNVRVYAIGVHDAAFQRSNLEQLAASSGGTYTEVDSARLGSFLRDLGAELSDQYLIGYRSSTALGTNVEVTARVSGQPGVATAKYTTPALTVPAVGPPKAQPHVNFWHTTTAALLACLACALLIGLAALALLAPGKSVRNRVEKFVTSAPPEVTKSWTATLLERAFPDDRGAERARRWALLKHEVELARVGMSAEQIVALSLLGAVLLGWLLVAVTKSPLAAVLGLIVPVFARVAIRVKVERQRRAFDEQLPDNLQVIAAAMRAGHTFVGALAIVADSAAEPSRRELRRVLADEQLGVPLGDALNSVTERMNSRDFEHVALVAALQRDTGGNTAEVIDTVTDTIRERLDLRRLVRTLTAQGRLSGWVVSALPVALLLLISLINPGYVHPLFHRAAGIIGLCIGATMTVCGSLIIRRIVNIKA
jgi:tight adherence protein B